MRRRALLASLGVALGSAGCSARSNETDQTQQLSTSERTPSPVHSSETSTPRESRTQSRTLETETATDSTPVNTVTNTPAQRSRNINLRIGYEGQFRNRLHGEVAPSGKQWFVVRYTAYNYGDDSVTLAPADFMWVGDSSQEVDSPTGPVPYTFLGRRAYTDSDTLYPDQSTTRSMTFAVPESATSQQLNVEFTPPATIEMYSTTLPDQRNCQLDEFDCKDL
jgi:hypothetical protein